MRTKKRKISHKRHGRHHKHSQSYIKVYWPYIPLLLFAIVLLTLSLVPTGKQSVLKYATELSHKALLAETNAQRSKNKVQNLEINEKLNKAAQAKALDMASRNYWSHKTPEGYDPWVFVDQAGYDYHKAGENLAYGFSNSLTTVLGWMNSPSHRDNMLDEAYTEVGFGFANAQSYQGSSEETIVVAIYGRPLTLGPHVASDARPLETSQSKPVIKAETIANTRLQITPLFIGLLGGGAASGLLINHSLRLRRFIKRSEEYFVAHPLLDVSLILIAIACISLSKTVGYIL